MGKKILKYTSIFILLELAIYGLGFVIAPLGAGSCTGQVFCFSFGLGISFILVWYILPLGFLIFLLNKFIPVKKEFDTQGSTDVAFKPNSTLPSEIIYWIIGIALPAWWIIMYRMSGGVVYLYLGLAIIFFVFSSIIFWTRVKPPLARTLTVSIVMVIAVIAISMGLR